MNARKKAEKRDRQEGREKERKRRFGVNIIISLQTDDDQTDDGVDAETSLPFFLSLFLSISLLRLFSRAHYWVNKYIPNCLRQEHWIRCSPPCTSIACLFSKQLQVYVDWTFYVFHSIFLSATKGQTLLVGNKGSNLHVHRKHCYFVFKLWQCLSAWSHYPKSGFCTWVTWYYSTLAQLLFQGAFQMTLSMTFYAFSLNRQEI